MKRRHFLQSLALTTATAALAQSAPPRRLLVLGGTGFLGRHVTEAALARNYEVTLFHLTEEHSALYPEVTHRIGNRDLGFPAMDGTEFDFVIDTSGQKPRWLDDSTRALKGCGRYLFVSTISVYKNSPSPLNEDSPVVSSADADLESLLPVTYPARKIACEHHVRQNCGARGLIVRPCLIAGPYDATDRFTYWPARLQRYGPVLAPHAPSEPVQWIDARDLSEWMLNALEANLEGTYNLTGPSPKQGFGPFLQSLKSHADLVWVGADFLEKVHVQPWVDLPLWVPSQSENAGFTQVSNQKAVQQGLRLRSALLTAQDTLAWRHSDPRPWHVGLTPLREQEVLKMWQTRPKA